MTSPGIRVKAICVFGYGGRILVAQGFDPVKHERFFRPLGGSVEFGEGTVEALRREIREELQQEIEAPVLLGVLENRFVFGGAPGHEIVFVFDARFVNTTLYTQANVPFTESGWDGDAVWIDPETPGGPLYPEGLVALLKQRRHLAAGE
jgi:ADP-ribose pyrophosphatase YjhB (NUDIX family)